MLITPKLKAIFTYKPYWCSHVWIFSKSKHFCRTFLITDILASNYFILLLYLLLSLVDFLCKCALWCWVWMKQIISSAKCTWSNVFQMLQKYIQCIFFIKPGLHVIQCNLWILQKPIRLMFVFLRWVWPCRLCGHRSETLPTPCEHHFQDFWCGPWWPAELQRVYWDNEEPAASWLLGKYSEEVYSIL